MTRQTLTLGMPARVSVLYVVAAPEGPPPPAAVTELADALPDGVELEVTELTAGHPAMAAAVRVLSCPDCSPDLDPLVPMLIDATGGHLAVRCSASPGWPPHHLTWAALATDQIARLTGGIRLDPGVPCLLPDPWRPAPLTTPEAFAVSEWVTVGTSREEAGRVGMHTTGLTAFGLPELLVRRLRPDDVHGWWHLFRALSDSLVRRTFDLDRGIESGPTLQLASEPVVAIPGLPPIEVEVRLRHLRRDGLLGVIAPRGYEGREMSWRSSVASSICGS
ncbi:hypothetical protein J5X84_32520 [Streptosporangiaceae bacterium NEAU-GS5]|nr:hypothetical protein [Streptosporangiaceae bacterium NEAU-GS5]